MPELAGLLDRRLPAGGYAGQRGGPLRVDATAWAILALEAAGFAREEMLREDRDLLVTVQQTDGRLIVLPRHLGSFWPTALAILAWQGSADHRPAQERAVELLFRSAGQTISEPMPILGDDPTLRGWPWIESTYAWVEPTSAAILALTAAGRGDHSRVGEGVDLLLDRQLPKGGWNFGNKSLFGTELRWAPESTGPALAALAGRVARAEVAHSLDKLGEEVAGIRSPLALGWALLGLSAWGERPGDAESWIEETLAGERETFSYDTAELALLLFGHHAEGGLLHELETRRWSPT